MKIYLTIILIVITASAGAQTQIAEAKFHEGSNLYINGNSQAALNSVNEGLRAEPNNSKLKALKKKLEEQKKKEEEQKKKEEQQKKDQQKKDQNKQNQDKKDQEKKEQEKKDQDKKEQEKKDQEKKDQEKKGEEKKDEKQEQDEQKKKEEEKQREEDRKELPQDVKDRLQEMKIPEEKAKMLLEAMRNQEIQYLQQNKRKAKKQPPQNNKPDW